MDASLEDVFTAIYRDGAWTSYDNVESLSGRGSTLWRTEALRRNLPGLLSGLGVSSLLDAACGDFNWLSAVDLPLDRYEGIDVVGDVIAQNMRRYASERLRFTQADIRYDTLPDCEAILCRDCLNHLSLADVERCLGNFRRTQARYLLLTTHPRMTENLDCQTGEWRMLNLCLAPIGLPDPEALVLENEDLGKYLGVWRL